MRREEAVTKLKLVRETLFKNTGEDGGHGRRYRGIEAEEWVLRMEAPGSAGMAEELYSATGGRRIRVKGSGWRVFLMMGLLFMHGLTLIGPLASRPRGVHWNKTYEVGTHGTFLEAQHILHRPWRTWSCAEWLLQNASTSERGS